MPHTVPNTDRWTAAWLGAIVGLALAAACNAAGAQSAQVSAGVTGASFTWNDGRREQAIATVVQATPAPWLVLGAVPTFLRADAGDGAQRAGFGDLPAFAGASHALPLPLRPMLSAAAVASFPTGNVDRGLGRGTTLVSTEGTLSLSPLGWLTVRGGGARLVRDGGLLPAGAARTAAFGDAVLTLGARTNASVGYSGEVGGDSTWRTVRARSVNAAVVRAIAGRTALLVSGSHQLHGVGPSWSVSLGVGTAFGGVSPVGASSVRGRAPTGTTPTSGTSQPLAPATKPGGVACGLLPTC